MARVQPGEVAGRRPPSGDEVIDGFAYCFADCFADRYYVAFKNHLKVLRRPGETHTPDLHHRVRSVTVGSLTVATRLAGRRTPTRGFFGRG